VVERWSWLGDPLAIDLANTVRRRGARYTDLIATPADLQVWLEYERSRVRVPPAVDERLTTEFLVVRDQVLRILRAAASGWVLPAADVFAINERVRSAPTVRLLATLTGRHLVSPVTRTAPGTRLLADLAASVVDLLSGPDAQFLALCDAPGCGQLFLRGRPNQNWCSPQCGARARTYRHARRSGLVAGTGPLAPPRVSEPVG
jgi:predicted RNA-binding Zn ribbon-like protein